MELKDQHIQLGKKELTNAIFLLQDIQNRSSGELVSERDKFFINIISTGLIQWNGCDVYENIDNGLYENYFKKPTHPVKPRLPRQHTSADAEIYAEELVVYETQLDDYRGDIINYRTHEDGLFKQFKKDSIQYCGLRDHPKAEQAFNKAWNDRHSDGYCSVVQELEELADLML